MGKKEEETKFELEKQKFLFDYWKSAENYTLATFGFLAGSIIIPTAMNTTFNFSNWVIWIFIIEIIAVVILACIRLTKYNKKQKDARDIVENLRI